MPVQFFYEKIDFSLDNPGFYVSWLETIISSNKKIIRSLNYVFCDDEHLLQMNKEYLDHNYYTDILTFDHSDDDNTIEADIYISVERVVENAVVHSVRFEQELSRVLIHGLLHLLGFKDGSAEEKKLMREKEDAYISLQKK